MNWLAFFASIIGSLAWPAMIIIVILIFKQQLLNAAPWLRELEVSNVKVRFAEELAKATSAAEQIGAPPIVAPPNTITDRDLVLAEHAPLGLVLQSWLNIEYAMVDAANIMGLSTATAIPRAPNVTKIARELEDRRVITPATAQTLHYLRDLRNRAVHHKGFVIDADQALEYARLSKKVLDALDEEPGERRGVAPVRGCHR